MSYLKKMGCRFRILTGTGLWSLETNGRVFMGRVVFLGEICNLHENGNQSHPDGVKPQMKIFLEVSKPQNGRK